MNPEIKVEWLKRLRSGDYEQGRGYLRFDNTYCCLGVLCEIAVEAGITNVHRPGGLDVAGHTYGYGTRQGSHDYSHLPREVMEWAGLHNPYGIYIPNVADADETLAHMNDRGVTFSEIADIIENHL